MGVFAFMCVCGCVFACRHRYLTMSMCMCVCVCTFVYVCMQKSAIIGTYGAGHSSLCVCQHSTDLEEPLPKQLLHPLYQFLRAPIFMAV